MFWAWVPPLEDDDRHHNKHLRAPVLRGAQHVLRRVLRSVLHVSPKGKRGGEARVCWAWVPPLEYDDRHHDEHFYAPVLHSVQLVLRHVLRHVLTWVFFFFFIISDFILL